MTWLFDQYGEWVKGFYVSVFQDVTNTIVDGAILITDSFWKDSLVNVFLNFSVTVNVIVAVVTILILCFDVAEEGKAINWSQVIGNVMKGALFALFSRYIGLMCLELSNLIVSKLQVKYDSETVWTGITNFNSGQIIMWCIIIIIAFVAFCAMCLVRNASMLVLIMSSSLYVPDIIRGDTAKMGDWMRQVIAVSFTFVFQYVMFNLGVSGLLEGQPFICLGGFVGMFVVSKMLQKYGYSSGVTGMASSAGNMAIQAGQFLIK